MTLLNKQGLDEIDQRIDSAISSQPLLRLSRDVALIHILRYFEDYNRLYLLKSKDSRVYSAAAKNGQDGMHFAVQWIFQYCPGTVYQPQLSTQEVAYLWANELHEAAMDYSMVWDFMSMLRRKRMTGEQDSDGTFHVRYANQLVTDIDLANRFVSAPNNPGFREDSIHSAQDFDPSSLLVDVQARPDGVERVKYQIPDSTFERIAEEQQHLLSQLWELDSSWDLSGYTVSQFREFWVALKTLCWIHHCVCFFSGVQGGALDSVVRILQRRRRENELARRSGLSKNIVVAILDDLIYDSGLYGPGRKQPDVTYQPFFPLGSGLLALSNWLVLFSNAERNIWDLVSIKRESVHSTLRNQKEALWLQEISPHLNSYGLRTYGPVNFSYAGRKSDVDLLIIDPNALFGLGCQLKWLTIPDRVRDVKYTDDELQKGLTQAALTLQWLNSRPNELQQLTKISTQEFAKYEFKAIVLSKNTIGSGWVHQPDIPILNERILHWTLGAPHRKNLRSLWRVGEEHRFLPKRGQHFIDKDVGVEFGGVRFLGEGCGMTLLTPWNPDTDIDVTGLV